MEDVNLPDGAGVSRFELYPAERWGEAMGLFLDWWVKCYFYSEESRSYACMEDEELHEICEQGAANGSDLKAIMAGRVAAEVMRLRSKLAGLTPQELSLREQELRRPAEAAGALMAPGAIIECEVAFALRCALNYDMTDADFDAEEAALEAMGLGIVGRDASPGGAT